MHSFDPRLISAINTGLWLVLVIYWFAARFDRKRTKRRQGFGSILVSAVILIFAVYAVGRRHDLSHLLFPVTYITQSLGLAACAAGIAFAIWARKTIGRNWSGLVTVKEDHDLIQTGPYSIVRHPIYTGLILAMAGSALAVHPSIRSFLIVLIWSGFFFLKARREESVMIEEFGERYLEFRRRVKGAIIP